ncbi:hypothetical protein BDK51DRAFT_25510 [Blyttiomyces helicus]|uniref:Uncharacterized protein n=1 Tax=Blyttiomyces helicus TaxID=388810 RepID=A0A4P9WAK5_9FUNG|nr:hypothetical protein BDK51DRAFT_25510 [Blyttiomyces helicus]|eukprot:RKO88595.1 hypothetical protein BDK51DRAFT_25510 [Blyttiomyces helicus]
MAQEDIRREPSTDDRVEAKEESKKGEKWGLWRLHTFLKLDRTHLPVLHFAKTWKNRLMMRRKRGWCRLWEEKCGGWGWAWVEEGWKGCGDRGAGGFEGEEVVCELGVNAGFAGGCEAGEQGGGFGVWEKAPGDEAGKRKGSGDCLRQKERFKWFSSRQFLANNVGGVYFSSSGGGAPEVADMDDVEKGGHSFAFSVYCWRSAGFCLQFVMSGTEVIAAGKRDSFRAQSRSQLSPRLTNRSFLLSCRPVLMARSLSLWLAKRTDNLFPPSCPLQPDGRGCLLRVAANIVMLRPNADDLLLKDHEPLKMPAESETIVYLSLLDSALCSKMSKIAHRPPNPLIPAPLSPCFWVPLHRDGRRGSSEQQFCFL